jgi:hypothetical protein
MARRKQGWDIGDLFLIKLLDGEFCIGEVVGYEPKALNSAICAFYSQKVSYPFESKLNIDRDSLVSVQFVTRDLLDIGRWKVVEKSYESFPVNRFLDLKYYKNKGFVGVTCYGSGMMEDLLNAYHCLSPWDDYYDPNKFDTMLISPDKKPTKVFIKKFDERDSKKLIKIAKKLHLSHNLLNEIIQSVENRNWQESIELLCNAILVNELLPDELEYRIISHLGNKLGMDSKFWSDIKERKA